ncbi:hypothetical protein GWK47_034105 [Chionoecetes opilio]|uniref:Ig-like domain-containing protein n=1 Tax=Chionoecetes opilio TaxID=41210 RepID=A0A8J5D333_CHIOP|nr:hypothetical protein GWK47_034105 [Chionoecetes opilio]
MWSTSSLALRVALSVAVTAALPPPRPAPHPPSTPSSPTAPAWPCPTCARRSSSARWRSPHARCRGGPLQRPPAPWSPRAFPLHLGSGKHLPHDYLVFHDFLQEQEGLYTCVARCGAGQEGRASVTLTFEPQSVPCP